MTKFSKFLVQLLVVISGVAILSMSDIDYLNSHLNPIDEETKFLIFIAGICLGIVEVLICIRLTLFVFHRKEKKSEIKKQAPIPIPVSWEDAVRLSLEDMKATAIRNPSYILSTGSEEYGPREIITEIENGTKFGFDLIADFLEGLHSLGYIDAAALAELLSQRPPQT